MYNGDGGAVVAPDYVGAALEVGEAQGLFHRAVMDIDTSAQFRNAHQRGQRGVNGQVGQSELDRFGLGGGPVGQQPAHGQFRAVGDLADLSSSGTEPRGYEGGCMHFNPLQPLPGCRELSHPCAGRAVRLPDTMTSGFTARAGSGKRTGYAAWLVRGPSNHDNVLEKRRE